MPKFLTGDAINKLLKLNSVDDAVAAVKAQYEKIYERAAAVSDIKAAYADRASSPASGLEQALDSVELPAALGAGAAGIATARLLELTKGSTTTYEAVLRREEIAGRLRTALEGDFGVRESGEEVVVARVDSMGVFCRIRVSIAGDKTTIVISGMSLTKTTQGADGVFGGLMNLGKKALQGDDIVGNVLDTIGEAVDTAKEIGSDLWVANTIADVIEKYGAERERALTETKRLEAVAEADKAAKERKEKSCSYCGAARELGKACPECGATES